MINNFYKYFLENYKGEGYRNYLTEKRKYAVKDFIPKSQQKLLESELNIYVFKIFDVLDNKQFSKLISKIYKLNKNEFEVICRYKKSSLLNKYSYIGIKYGTSQYGELATIKFINDEYLDNIDILWSHLDDWRGFIEYTFNLKKPINNSSYEDFLDKYLCKINKKDLKLHFRMIDNSYSDFDFINKNSLNIIFQHFITSFLFTEDGKNDFLPSMSFETYDIEYDYTTFKNDFMTETFINKKKNYVIEKDITSNHYILLSSKSRPIINVSKFIMDYGTTFYYLFFGKFELDKVKYLFSPQVSSTKKISTKKVKYLFDLMESTKLERKTIFSDDEKKEWAYLCGDNNLKTIDEKPMFDYKDFYDQYYHYFRNILELRNITITKVLSIVAIVVAIIGVLLSVVTSLISGQNSSRNNISTQESSATVVVPSDNTTLESTTTSEEDEIINKTLVQKIDNVEAEVLWDYNESVNELKKLAKDGLTIYMSMYSIFEQVDSLRQTIKSSDASYTATAGDICLYQSNQIVLFYDFTTYEYTKLGHMKLNKSELEELLCEDDVTITLTLKNK